MVIVVGDIPAQIRVPRAQYLSLLSRLDAALHATSPTQVELANDILDIVRTWPESISGQVNGQMELPLEWAESREGR
jgi:hypothetical protein